jgi:hypothetical protein
MVTVRLSGAVERRLSLVFSNISDHSINLSLSLRIFIFVFSSSLHIRQPVYVKELLEFLAYTILS